MENKYYINNLINSDLTYKYPVPNIAFTYWEGTQLSWLQYYTIYSFCKYNPSYDVIIYTCSDIIDFNISMLNHPSKININKEKRIHINEISKIKNVKFVYVDILKYVNSKIEIICPVRKADIVRIVKLYEHGGVWIDMDILFIKQIPEYIIRNTIDISYFGYGGVIATGFIISTPKNKSITMIYNKCIDMLQTNCNITDYQVFGPLLFRDCVLQNNELFKDCKFLDNNVIYPYMWDQPQIFFFTNDDYCKDNTIGIHWYNGNGNSRNYINEFDNTNITPEKCVFEKYLYKILNN